MNAAEPSTVLEAEQAAEVAARMEAIRRALAQQVAGQPVPGSHRLARNIAAHVGLGEGAAILQATQQEQRRRQRGRRRQEGSRAAARHAQGTAMPQDSAAPQLRAAFNGVAAVAVAGNIVTVWSWFGTNMLGVGLHSYGFMDSAVMWLVLFVGSQFIIILLAALPGRKPEQRPTG